MKRKLMSMLLVFVLLASLSPAVAADAMSAQPTVKENLGEYHEISFEEQNFDTLTGIVATDEEVIVHDLARNQRIDYLFYIRGRLEADFEQNQEEILLIDQELQTLGVETLTYEELMCKMGNVALPMVEVVSFPATNWTSRRVVVTYAGQHYELQIIEGVPVTTSSGLWIEEGRVSHTAKGFIAGTLNVLDARLEGATGKVPIVGNVISVYSFLADLAETYGDAFSETTVVESATGVALITMKAHMKYIFVKGYGSSDQMQLLSYVGNSVNTTITTVVSKPFLIDGELQSKHETKQYVTTDDSDFYTDYSVPARTYYLLRNNVSPLVIVDYSFKTLEVEILGHLDELDVPYETLPIAN